MKNVEKEEFARKNTFVGVRCYDYVREKCLGENKDIVERASDSGNRPRHTLETAEATIATLRHLPNDEENLNQQIDAPVIFLDRIGIDSVEEHYRHYRPRRRPRRIDEQSETEARLDLDAHCGKEFVQILDHQITTISDNVKVAFNIIVLCIKKNISNF